jgi:hypothetical protein
MLKRVQLATLLPFRLSKWHDVAARRVENLEVEQPVAVVLLIDYRTLAMPA